MSEPAEPHAVTRDNLSDVRMEFTEGLRSIDNSINEKIDIVVEHMNSKLDDIEQIKEIIARQSEAMMEMQNAVNLLLTRQIPTTSTAISDEKTLPATLSGSKQNLSPANPPSSDSSDHEYSDHAQHGTNKYAKRSTNQLKTDRRSTIFDNVSQMVNANAKPTIYQVQDDKVIILRGLTIPSVIIFIEEMVQNYKATGYMIPYAKCIPPNIRDNLISRNHTTLTLDEYYNLRFDQLVVFLRKAVQPTSRMAFSIALSRIPFEMLDNYKPSALDFLPFYDAYIKYSNRFVKTFQFLAQGNPNNVPSQSNKDGGLYKIFLSKIPLGYGNSIYSEIVADDLKFPDFEDFVNEVNKRIYLHYKDFEKARNLAQFLNPKNAVVTTSLNVYTGHGDKREFAAKPNYSKQSTNKYPNATNFQRPQIPQQVHNLQRGIPDYPDDVYTQYADYYEDMDSWTPTNIETQEDVADDIPPGSYLNAVVDEEEDNYAVSHPYHSSESFVTSPTVLQNTQRNSTQGRSIPASNSTLQPTGKPTATRACYKLLMYKSCTDPNCKMSHDPKDMTEYAAYVLKTVKESPFCKPATSLHLMTSEQISPDLLEVLASLAMHDNPGVSLLSPVHRHGIINPNSDNPISVDNALFDTGALHASYISGQLIDCNPSLKALRREYNGIVTLADNSSISKITHVIDLAIQFLSATGVPHCAVVTFNILPTLTTDMIVGLPDIAYHFGTLMHEMVDGAIRAIVSDRQPDTARDPTLTSVFNTTPLNEPDPTYPWLTTFLEEAPEDTATPQPCSFPDALHYMEMTYDDAVTEYLSSLDSHVSPEFKAATPVMDLLRTLGKDVFVPSNWEGINGLEPLELQFKDTLPQSMKPKARFINPKMLGRAEQEFRRLSGYMYQPSTSPIASPMVVAPKATDPFIRLCGNYIAVNEHIHIPHYPIPHVMHQLERISHHKIFIDLDMSNSFHQIRLGPTTSQRLSLQTPWGQYEPKFVPEGVGPASAALQSIVSSIFTDFQEWAIVIFDNFLLLASDFDDAYNKLRVFLQRCKDRNIFLKFSKSWLGFPEAKFFGYIVHHGSYELSAERKAGIDAIPFPANQKQMQSFLGAALFFKSFIPQYSTLTAKLNDMIKSDFSWTESTWTEDYKEEFKNLKTAICNASSLFYPDYSLKWIMRVDASLHGVGAALYQIKDDVLQPIAHASQKFSEQASKWTTIEQEAYSCYFGFNKFSYYIQCKPFILETDHNNLVWMEQSLVPKIIRWRIYMQGFDFSIRHIKGISNTIADFLSRIHQYDTADNDDTTYIQHLHSVLPTTPETILKMVHGGRNGHHGVRRTYNLLNKMFAGHRISIAKVRDFIAECPICQKLRIHMVDQIEPIVRHLKPPHQRSAVGVDTLTVTPVDTNGNLYCVVIVNHFTKFTFAYPQKSKDAHTVALSLFQYFCTFGKTDAIYSDPGSEYMSDVVKQLNIWFGINTVFSLVDRHESNGVEGPNKQILRHLMALVHDERIVNKWSSPDVFPLILHMINETYNTESGIIPLHAMFGSADETYHRLPKEQDINKVTNNYIKLLDENLRVIRSISKRYQDSLVVNRIADTPDEKQNQFQSGDFILLQRDLSKPLPNKLCGKFYGPVMVISQEKNDITTKDMVTGLVRIVHVTRVKPFHGTHEDAMAMARLDNDQHVVERIVAYRGDVDTRTTMEFEVLFADGTLIWLPWSNDIISTIAFEDYCRSLPCLYHLIFTVSIAKQHRARILKTPIHSIKLGDTAYVDLRCYGDQWYHSLTTLPDVDHNNYVVAYIYKSWITNQQLKVKVTVPAFDESHIVDSYFVYRYGSVTQFDQNTMILIDVTFVLQHLELLEASKRPTYLRRHRDI